MPVKCICKQCGKEFGVRTISGGRGKYCSHKCYSISRKVVLKGTNNPMFGRGGVLNPFFGKKHTEETLEKMRGPRVMSDEWRINNHKANELRCGRTISARTLLYCGNCGKEIIEGYRRTRKYCSKKCLDESKIVDKIQGVCPTCGESFFSYPKRPHKYCCRMCVPNPNTPDRCATHSKRMLLDGNPRWLGGEILEKERQWAREHISPLRFRPITPDELKTILMEEQT